MKQYLSRVACWMFLPGLVGAGYGETWGWVLLGLWGVWAWWYLTREEPKVVMARRRKGR